MRALAMLSLFALPAAFAAPVPKELRKPTMVGKWVIVESVVWGREKPIHLGELWEYGADGSMTRSGHPASGRFEVRPGGVDIWFDGDPTRCLARTEFEGDMMKLAFPIDQAVRATDCAPANNRAVWTLKRIKE